MYRKRRFYLKDAETVLLSQCLTTMMAERNMHSAIAFYISMFVLIPTLCSFAAWHIWLNQCRHRVLYAAPIVVLFFLSVYASTIPRRPYYVKKAGKKP